METGTFKYKGKEYEIWRDQTPFNPRDEWDNLGTMVCFHSSYTLGDEQPSGDPEEVFLELLREHDSKLDEMEDRLAAVENHFYQGRLYGSTSYRCGKLVAYARRLVIKRREYVRLNKLCVLPLNLYDHSGITMSTTGFSCGWDSGQVGWIYITLDQARNNWGLEDHVGWDFLMEEMWSGDWFKGKTLRDCTMDVLQGEVKEYDAYLRGEVYGWSLCDYTFSDSCGGYLVPDYDLSSLHEEAKRSIDYYVKKEMKEHVTKLKAQIKNHVPLYARVAGPKW